MGEKIVFVESQEGIQFPDPIRHPHRDMPGCLILRIIQIHGDDPLQLLDFLLPQVILGDRDVRF